MARHLAFERYLEKVKRAFPQNTTKGSFSSINLPSLDDQRYPLQQSLPGEPIQASIGYCKVMLVLPMSKLSTPYDWRGYSFQTAFSASLLLLVICGWCHFQYHMRDMDIYQQQDCNEWLIGWMTKSTMATQGSWMSSLYTWIEIWELGYLNVITFQMKTGVETFFMRIRFWMQKSL